MDVVGRNIPVEFSVRKTYEVEDTRFMEVTIKLMHTEENFNGSYFAKDVVQSAIPSLANTPILAYIEENKDGEIDYSDHRQVLVKDDGQYKIKYIGQAIGVIPETNNARFEKQTTESGIEREYLVVDGLLWTKWDDPIDILQRDTKHQQSMEVHQNYQGRFEDDNLFHFTSFQFFGACALSNIDILPAMEEASIELKFSSEDFKKEIQEKMEQFKQFSKIQPSANPEVDINTPENNFEKEEKLKLDEKLEVLTKYNLTPESISFSIEELSIEEIEVKAKEQFELLASQKEEELDNAIRSEMFVDRWGDNCSKYSPVDHTDSEVFAYDRQENYNLFGFAYSASGDSVVVDFTSKKRKKFEIVDFIEGTVVISMFPQEAIDYAISDKEKELTAQFTTEKETAVNEVQTLLDTITTEYELVKPEIVRLQEFEVVTLSELRADQETEMFSQYEEKLTGVEEFEALKTNSANFTLENLEKELALLFVKKTANFSVNKVKKATVKISVSHEDDVDNEPYGGLFTKYLDK
ncbi:MAG TPA: hypothetical protein VIM70_01575 [Clostridium sp.]|uniref:hypothetical protein n=1 Tax=Clostridium sp. TaxID=1506 RepID=UPI002F937ABF